jgi:CheY-like chemotaxis protein
MTTTSAGSGAEALELVPEEGPAARFDVALIDFHMPNMDGLELAGRLNGYPSSKRVPFVLLTSGGDQSQTARRMGIAGYATKPLRQARLREELVSALEGGRSRDVPDAEAVSQDRAGGKPEEAATTLPVLVAEDNPTNQAVAVKWLERIGFRAETASDGREALDALGRRPFAAVLMDCQMPRLDGYETTRELRRRENGGRRTAVIAMTANAMQGDRERCLQAGMDDYLAKPLRPHTLRGVLERWVSADGGANADAPDGGATPALLPVAR